MEKLKALFNKMANDIAAFFGADTTEQIDQQDINEVLDYLESMGYDLKGYGFITEDKTEDDIEDADSQYLDKEQGVIRNSDGDTVADATSMFISTYLISDNYAYTLKNDNIVTQDADGNWLKKMITGVGTATLKIYNAIALPIFNVVDSTVETWGRGLIIIYYDDGIGVKKKAVDDDSLWNWDNVHIDAEKKVLSIKRHSLFNNNAALEFSLDGWTGRYSMPLEFLLSVHIATMKPDLAYDMATSFATNVNIYLHATTSGTATAAYKVGGTYITWSDIQDEIDIMGKSNNWFKAFINWFDNLHDSGDELAAVKELGIDIGTGSGECTCTIQKVYFDESGENVLTLNEDGTYSYATKDDDTTDEETDEEETEEDDDDDSTYSGTVQEVTEVTEWCDYCRSKFSAIKKYLSNYNDYHYQAYIPYIASVTDHWYRDVYFVLDNDKDSDGVPDGFVEYDYDYETVMNERWTSYEIDDNGEYVLYLLDDDGNTTSTKMTDFLEEKGYDSQEEAEDAGYAFVKKAEIVLSSDVDALTDLGWSNENGTGIWTAYTVKETSTSSGYERAYEDDEIDDSVASTDIEKEVVANVYINVETTGNVTQTGEGQRTETNSTIKKMFLQNNYFTYDGTTNTANIIEALRNDNDLGYGAVSDSDLEKTAEYDSETYTVKDYVSTVSLEQDSLDAFSMLENTHTLDADYIYRDFKELIVELGYFTKEELTDETPQLLQWLIPDIGSGPMNSTTTTSTTGSVVTAGNEIIADMIEDGGWKYESGHGFSHKDTWAKARQQDDKTTTCVYFVAWIYQEAGYLKEGTYINHTNDAKDQFEKNCIDCEWIDTNDTIDELVSDGTVSEGDMLIYGTNTIAIYAGKSGDSYLFFHANDESCFKDMLNKNGACTNSYASSHTITAVIKPDSSANSLGSSSTTTLSTGFPDRTIDKNENEFGTMIHSKGDIDANRINTLVESYKRALQEQQDGTVDETTDDEGDYDPDRDKTATATKNVNTTVGATTNVLEQYNTEQAITEIVSGMGSDFERISESGDGYDYKVRVGGVEYTHYYQFKGSYAEKTFTWSGATKTIHRAACGPTSCVNLLTGYGLDVNPTNDIVGISFNATIQGCSDFMASYGVEGEVIDSSNWKTAIEEAFAEGRPIITLMNNANNGFWTSGGHFVAMIGQDSNGNIITLDSGSSNSARHTYTGGVDGLLLSLKGLWVANEPPSGTVNSDTAYVGYLGNEAVVSPVTGVLLEYGTYTTEVDSVTGEEYRVNTDLLYPSDGSEAETVSDKVGYAKILVLDAENYRKLESTTSNSWEKNSLLSTTTKIDSDNNTVVSAYYKDDPLDDESELESWAEDWSDIDKTVYGYKQFAEEYEMAGISGYIVYIDGFSCELVDEEFTEGQLEESVPNGEAIDLNTFKSITEDNIGSEDSLQSLYEQDDTYKLASQKASDKANAEATVKMEASSSIYTDGLIFIKEGTVLGRTITDYELITEIRGESEEKYKEYRPDDETTTTTTDTNTTTTTDDEENEGKVMGNYVRILFKDTDDTVVENVEDYMKLDDGEIESNGLIDGDTFVIPEEVMNLQMTPTYEALNRKELGMSQWSSGTTQRSIWEFWRTQSSSAYDDNGKFTGNDVITRGGIAYVTIDGKEYVTVAVKETFGVPGDYLQVVFDNGDIVDCVIQDAKGTDDGSYYADGDHGNVDYGHYDGSHVSVLELVIKGQESGSTYTPGSVSTVTWYKQKVAQITNGGSIYSK